MTLTPLDLLYLALALSALILTVYVSYLAFQTAKTLKEIRPILEDIRDIAEDVRDLKDGVKTSFSSIASLVTSFIPSNSKKSTKKEE
jgi:hypothetical protein